MEVIIYNDPDTGRALIEVPAYGDLARPANETDEQLWARIIARFPKQADSSPIPHWIIEAPQMPAGRTFRNAWRCVDGQLKVDMVQARLIQMDRIRQVRNKALEALDVPWLKAMETGDQTTAAEIARQKQLLRDIPQTFNLSGARTTTSLKTLWPPELPK